MIDKVKRLGQVFTPKNIHRMCVNSNTKYKRSNSKSDLQGNFELETLLVNHKKYYEQIGKIKEFIKNIK